MSLLPYILGELRDLSGDGYGSQPSRRQLNYPSRRWVDVDTFDDLDDLLLFGDDWSPRPAQLRLLSDDGPRGLTFSLVPRYRRPQQQQQQQHHQQQQQHRRHWMVPNAADKKQAVKRDDSHGLAVDLDVQQFRPEELSVQVLKDQGVVVVEGRHEERHDKADEFGFVRHHFARRFKIPADVDPDTITSRLTADGTLQVTAPRREALHAPKEANVRTVLIAQADKPAPQPAQDGDKEAAGGQPEEKKESPIQKVD